MDDFNDLGDLSNPKNYSRPLSLENIPTEKLLEFYKSIYTIRRCEEILGEMAKSREIKTPIHLGIGQEAVAVGMAENLTVCDKVFSNHRGHSHYLSMGGSVERLFAEVLGKSSGASRGMGGSMHLVERDVGFWGSVPIVGGTIPIAVGAALAAKHDDKNDISVAYFGDGACEEGVLHESLNLAQLMKLPIIFVCENNLYSSHMDIHLRQPSNSVARFARAHKMQNFTIDGNDVVEVANVASKAVQDARARRGPSFIEAVTFRWRGHVGPEVDFDVGVSRSKSELEAWMKRDPLTRLKRSMVTDDRATDGMFKKIELSVDQLLNDCLDRARTADEPQLENILDFVYGKN